MTAMQYPRPNQPHDNIESKERHRKGIIVYRRLLHPLLIAPAVSPEHNNRQKQRDASNNEEGHLRPDLCRRSPRREVVPCRKILCCVENGKSRAEHGEDDEGAGEVCASEEDLGNADADFDFLEVGC